MCWRTSPNICGPFRGGQLHCDKFNLNTSDLETPWWGNSSSCLGMSDVPGVLYQAVIDWHGALYQDVSGVLDQAVSDVTGRLHQVLPALLGRQSCPGRPCSLHRARSLSQGSCRRTKWRQCLESQLEMWNNEYIQWMNMIFPLKCLNMNSFRLSTSNTMASNDYCLGTDDLSENEFL